MDVLHPFSRFGKNKFPLARRIYHRERGLLRQSFSIKNIDFLKEMCYSEATNGKYVIPTRAYSMTN